MFIYHKKRPIRVYQAFKKMDYVWVANHKRLYVNLSNQTSKFLNMSGLMSSFSGKIMFPRIEKEVQSN